MTLKCKLVVDSLIDSYAVKQKIVLIIFVAEKWIYVNIFYVRKKNIKYLFFL